MFVETLKNIVTTLVTMLIFISAVEIIAPDDKMKKYIKFILGLILISVILNPIINFISNGEKNIGASIESYEAAFSNNKTDIDNMETTKDTQGINDSRKKAFITNSISIHPSPYINYLFPNYTKTSSFFNHLLLSH